jgi:hypothetical protein
MCTCTIFEMGVDWKKNQENSGIKISVAQSQMQVTFVLGDI